MNQHYEEEYHKTLHGYLYQSPKYYELRAKLAYLNYFKGMNLKNKNILEYGCGLGQNIYYLNNKGINVQGYDISKFAIGFCKKRGLNASSNLTKKDKFDIIFSRHVLEHLKNPFEILVKIRKNLNKQGTLILIIPHEIHEKVELKPDINMHLYCWNFRTINNILHEAGFKVIKNEILPFGMGYKKLAFLSKISFGLYDLATKLAGRLRGAKEMRIIAVKK